MSNAFAKHRSRVLSPGGGKQDLSSAAPPPTLRVPDEVRTDRPPRKARAKLQLEQGRFATAKAADGILWLLLLKKPTATGLRPFRVTWRLAFGIKGQARVATRTGITSYHDDEADARKAYARAAAKAISEGWTHTPIHPGGREPVITAIPKPGAFARPEKAKA